MNTEATGLLRGIGYGLAISIPLWIGIVWGTSVLIRACFL